MSLRAKEKMINKELSLTVLAVDDDPKALEILKVYLETEGHIVFTAANGAEALEMMGIYTFDVVITDVIMPHLGGLELCRQIKSKKETSFIPVMLVTVLGQKEDRIQGIEAGCDDFFTKPFDRLELLVRVRSLGRSKRSNEDLEHAEEVLKTLALGIEARNIETGDHCHRLVEIGTAFARFLQLDYLAIEAIAKAGVLHDIGKIAIPDAVLLKPGPLNHEEWQIMKTHPVRGEALLKPLRTVQNVLPIVRHHHERWDGKGYPDGIKGEEIPYLARVFQLVDIFDALVSPRPYKKAVLKTEALEIQLAESREGKRDPLLTEKFIRFQLQYR
jgi:putative two-component system response regulator